MSEEKLVPKLRFSGFTDEWSEHKFENIFDIKNGLNKGKDYFGEGIRILNYMDVNKYELNTENTIKGLVELTDDEIERYSVKPNDLFFTRTSETSEEIGLTSAYMGNTIKCVFSGFLLRARPKIDLNSLFFAYYLRSPRQRNNIIKFSSITTRALISGGNLSKMKIKYPSIEEQNKIANLFLILDKKVELLERKYREYQCFKKYLMQKLFAQELRFDFNDTWKTVKIKDIFDERSEKGFLDLELLSVTLNDGVIKRSEIESKDNSNENKSNYKHVLPGDIVYNSMRMWQGASGVSPYEGIVSPAYTILIPKNVYSKYFGYYFKTNEMVYQFKKYSQGLTSDTWNLKYPLISEIKIKIPSIEEQKEITIIFEIMDEKIKILQNNIDELTTFKKGLLQQMFVYHYYKIRNISKNGVLMKTKIITNIQTDMKPFLDKNQLKKLENTLKQNLEHFDVIKKDKILTSIESKKNQDLVLNFLSAKQVEGCSQRTVTYYRTTIIKMLDKIKKKIEHITTDDLRTYLANYKKETNSSKITIDNIRRVLSSFFSWLEDEDYIVKNPVRRIHKIKTRKTVKEVLTDENFEILRDTCTNIRDLAMVELLNSTGIRVGELVNLNIDDVFFNERECIVLGKGDSERTVYFDAKTKIHLMNYLETRKDENPALFVSFKKPYNRLGINGVERRIRELGKQANIKRVHPHKFRRTMATNAIDKGMPIEQVQKLLGHVQIDTTMHYAMVNQNNVKNSHRKYLS